MKVIDLLNKIANGEEVPKKIKYLTSIYTLRSNNNYYVENSDSSHSNGLYYQMIGGSRLNDEVEIIEEETKPITKESIEALGYACGEIKKCFANGWNKSLENKPLTEEDKKIEKLHTSIDYTGVILSLTDIETRNKINEIIDVLNEMREDK